MKKKFYIHFQSKNSQKILLVVKSTVLCVSLSLLFILFVIIGIIWSVTDGIIRCLERIREP